MAVEMVVVNHPSGGVPPGKRRLIPIGSSGHLVLGYDAMNLCDLEDVHPSARSQGHGSLLPDPPTRLLGCAHSEWEYQDLAQDRRGVCHRHVRQCSTADRTSSSSAGALPSWDLVAISRRVIEREVSLTRKRRPGGPGARSERRLAQDWCVGKARAVSSGP
jgi:hypothetical protein